MGDPAHGWGILAAHVQGFVFYTVVHVTECLCLSLTLALFCESKAMENWQVEELLPEPSYKVYFFLFFWRSRQPGCLTPTPPQTTWNFCGVQELLRLLNKASKWYLTSNMFLKAANNVETHIWVGIDIYLILALSKDKSCFLTPIKQLSTGYLYKFKWTHLLFTSRRVVWRLDCILTCAHTALFSGLWSVFLLLQFASSGALLLPSLPKYLQMTSSMLVLCLHQE